MLKFNLRVGLLTATTVAIAGLYALDIASARSLVPAIEAEITDAEANATLAALKPPKRERPIIAVLGANEGTETTDYLVPLGVLRRANIGEVIALGTQAGPIKMMPALTIQPDSTTAQFDALHPNGADYIIVPALHDDKDAASIAWIKAQAAKGSIVIGVCSGAKVLANAGLLDNRNATTHWSDVAKIQRSHPLMRYVPNRRFVVDRGVVTTTGVSASIPISLTLIEAIAGRVRATQIANELGVTNWDARHNSSSFSLSRNVVLSAASNTMMFWRHERIGIGVNTGIDEVALALTADAWSRTYRSRAVTIGDSHDILRTRNDIMLMADKTTTQAGDMYRLRPIISVNPAHALDAALADIAQRYGSRTSAFVALQLEYATERRTVPSAHTQ